jgi:hypothetical protein
VHFRLLRVMLRVLLQLPPVVYFPFRTLRLILAFASATAKAGQQASSGVSVSPATGNWVGISLGLTIGVVGGLGLILA